MQTPRHNLHQRGVLHLDIENADWWNPQHERLAGAGHQQPAGSELEAAGRCCVAAPHGHFLVAVDVPHVDHAVLATCRHFLCTELKAVLPDSPRKTVTCSSFRTPKKRVFAAWAIHAGQSYLGILLSDRVKNCCAQGHKINH